MIEGDFLKDSAIDAAIWAGAPGAGNAAFAKILSGEVNPSGRLPDTMWMDNAKNPVNVNFGWWVYENAEELDVSVHVGDLLYPEVTLASYVVYQEGVYLGYKYTKLVMKTLFLALLMLERSIIMKLLHILLVMV